MLYFATHVAVLSIKATKDLKPYPGGWFVGLNLKNGKCTALGSAPPGEGIVTLAADFPRKRLYGLTYPSAFLVMFDLSSNQVRNIGSVGGEQYQPADQVPFKSACRYLGVDSDTGRVYGSRDDGSIFFYDPQADHLAEVEVNVRDGIKDSSNLPRSGISWRSIRYDPGSRSFYGTCSNGPWLFRFDPKVPAVTPLGRMAAEPLLSAKDPDGIIATLAFDLSHKGVLYQIVPGVPLTVAGRVAIKEQAHLVSYDLKNNKLKDHGALYGGDCRVLASQSMTVTSDGTIWAMAYIESSDASRPIGNYGVHYERTLIRVNAMTVTSGAPIQ